VTSSLQPIVTGVWARAGLNTNNTVKVKQGGGKANGLVVTRKLEGGGKTHKLRNI